MDFSASRALFSNSGRRIDMSGKAEMVFDNLTEERDKLANRVADMERRMEMIIQWCASDATPQEKFNAIIHLAKGNECR